MALGVVLAGGWGRRLGGQKAGVALAGRPLISYPLEALRAAVGEVVIAAAAETELPRIAGVEVWREPAGERHPLTGIVHALRRAQGRAVVVCAVDLPLVGVDTLRTLARAGVTTVVRGQPLLARYEPAALAALAGFDPGARTTDVVAALAPAWLDVDPIELTNVNTPADLAAVERALSRT